MTVPSDRRDDTQQAREAREADIRFALDGNFAHEEDWIEARDHAEMALDALVAERDRYKNERDAAIQLLRDILRADKNDNKYGMAPAGDSELGIIFSLRVMPFLAALAGSGTGE